MNIWTFKIKNQYLNEKIEKLLSSHKEDLTAEQLTILKLVVLKFKKHSNNDEFLYFTIVYWMYYFGHISIDSPYISNTHRWYIDQIISTLKAEMNHDIYNYIKWLLEMEEELFLLKVIIKSIIINEPEKFWLFIPDIKQYYRAIGWIIPILSYKEMPKLLNEYQDKYFEKVYNEEFNWTKNTYKQTIAKIDVVENFMVDVINDLNKLLEELSVYARITVRRKSYFSIYNKMKRKWDSNINDFIWVRIIFKTEDDLFKFARVFEEKFIIEKKKNYIKSPKPSWYRALHYIFTYYFENLTKMLEIQLRTEEMNVMAHFWKLAHFVYSSNQNKWDPLFVEVSEALEVIKDMEIQPYWDKMKIKKLQMM